MKHYLLKGRRKLPYVQKWSDWDTLPHNGRVNHSAVVLQIFSFSDPASTACEDLARASCRRFPVDDSNPNNAVRPCIEKVCLPSPLESTK